MLERIGSVVFLIVVCALSLLYIVYAGLFKQDR